MTKLFICIEFEKSVYVAVASEANWKWGRGARLVKNLDKQKKKKKREKGL